MRRRLREVDRLDAADVAQPVLGHIVENELVRLALRNALLPVVNILGMIFSFLLGANVLIEQVFGWPGVGRYAVEAVVTSDYAAIQGFVVAMGLETTEEDLMNTVFPHPTLSEMMHESVLDAWGRAIHF